MALRNPQRFHGYYDDWRGPRPWTRSDGPAPSPEIVVKHFTVQERKLSYRFYPHLHPYVAKLVQRLLAGSVRGLEDADTASPPLRDDAFFTKEYDPDPDLMEKPFPVKDLDFSSRGPYAVYNWELFFHVPFAIAVHLSKNQRFEEAQRWFHYVFDPTDDSDGPTPARFWKVKPFQTTDVERIEQILINLSSGADPELREETITAIGAWKDAPFRPHLVARYRPAAYMLKVVMAYLDNLVDWGDSLFRQDTGESLNEATQLYVLAASILGPRPQAVPKKGTTKPQTYAGLRRELDRFGNALVEIEAEIPLDVAPHPGDAADLDRFSTLSSLGKTLYFGVPRNDKLIGYWDTVADRLFKIRNSLNLQGAFRQVPLFEPMLDPALFARAAAAGLDVGAVIRGVNQPLPLVRFATLAQKAAEICQEVKALGSNLLATLEKEDNEALALLRAKHERVILGLVEAVRYSQLQEAIKAREGLERSLAQAGERYRYYERLLGKQESEIKLPELEALDPEALLKLKLSSEEPHVEPRAIKIQIGSSFRDGGHKLSPAEARELDLQEAAQVVEDVGTVLEATGAGLNLIPDIHAHATPLGVGVAAKYGGSNLGRLFQGLAGVARGTAARISHEANLAGKMASYDRREQEWALQSNLAAGEISVLFKQIRAAQIREAIAQREWESHKKQMQHAEDIEQFLTDEKSGKKTNQAFYAWMKREVKGLYGQCFQLAFDVAKKAERALQHELGDPSLSFLNAGYLSGKEGLLAGEKLYLDLKRMEMAYLDLNRREYELTKHVSLLAVDPAALLQLRATGRCTVVLREELFDLDCPGHYFRRLRSVALSIPCVAGPYASVNCTLTLLKSSIRKSSLLRDGGYARDGAEDDRFSDHFGSMDAIVTSTAESDSGMFAVRDDRYLPFEGSGVVSEWQLELPGDLRSFDYDTIQDVVLHLRYTAREGGAPLRAASRAAFSAWAAEPGAPPFSRMFSLRHEFAVAWTGFVTPAESETPEQPRMVLDLSAERFPIQFRDKALAVREVEVLVKLKSGAPSGWTLWLKPPTGADERVSLESSGLGFRRGNRQFAEAGASPGAWTLRAEGAARAALAAEIEDIVLLCHYALA
ncbi:insecticidal toxin protein [Sorangium sp. So ce233]|uniref:Tc toxin subunit A-related protein n=1 Tax=Sorangium sp. So ce233 TaxID=3133290 RepID=UPI003F61CD07